RVGADGRPIDTAMLNRSKGHTRMRTLPITIAGALLALATAPVAHCDDNSFLDAYNRENPVRMFNTNHARVVQAHEVCDQLRAGTPPEQLNTPWPFTNRDSLIPNAQREICPDTLQ